MARRAAQDPERAMPECGGRRAAPALAHVGARHGAVPGRRQARVRRSAPGPEI